MARPGATVVNQADGSAVGDVRSSMLTLAQFQTQNGTNWVLADGTSAAGTKYNTITGNANFPDLRGVGLRGKNNGRSDGNQDPDGERALGAFQDHNVNSHTHVQPAHTHNTANNAGAAGGGAFITPNNNGPVTYGSGTLTTSATATNNNFGGNETRMRNVAVNHFIKAN